MVNHADSRRTRFARPVAACLPILLFGLMPLATVLAQQPFPTATADAEPFDGNVQPYDPMPGPTPDDAERIAYLRRYQDATGLSHTEIVVLDLDTNTDLVAHDEPHDALFTIVSRPRWSHTSDALGRRWIVFAVSAADPNGPTTTDILAVKEDGADLHVVTTLAGTSLMFSTPSLSPDDRWLSFSDGQTDAYDIYVQEFNPTAAIAFNQPINLTQGQYGDWRVNPVWSPALAPSEGAGGIAFEAGIGSNNDVYRMYLSFAADGSFLSADTAANLTATSNYYEEGPDWSVPTAAYPEGRIGYRVGYSIEHMNPDGSDLQLVDERRAHSTYGPSFAPTADRIAISYTQGGGKPDLLVIDLDGSTVVNLTDTRTIRELAPTWRPRQWVRGSGFDAHPLGD